MASEEIHKSNAGENSAGNAPTKTQETPQSGVSEGICTKAKTKRAKKKWYQKPNNWIKSATVIFVGIYTVFTYFMMRTSHHTEQRQLRAYVGPYAGNYTKLFTLACPDCTSLVIPPPLNTEERDTLTFVFKNFGASPAYRLDDCFALIPMGTGSEITTATATKRLKSCTREKFSALFPKQDAPIKMPLPTGWVIALSLARMKKIDAYLVGFISYNDIFHKRHKTYLCFKYAYDGKDHLISCPNVFADD